MANTLFFSKTALTGGAANALDYISHTLLSNGDFAFVTVSGILYIYKYNSASSVTEASPNVIAPDSGTGRWELQNSYLAPPQGFLVNGKIVPSVASNNLTVALKTLAGNNPSVSDPVFIRIGDTVRAITSALSVTKNAGTNWGNAGGAELATQEMNIVVQNMEKRGMIEGYTSIIYKTPDEDIGFWYNNMNNSLVELRSINPDATKLEKSNVLMKLRESLTDNNRIVVPPGIERFPYNALFAVYNLILIIIIICGGVPWLKEAFS